MEEDLEENQRYKTIFHAHTPLETMIGMVKLYGQMHKGRGAG